MPGASIHTRVCEQNKCAIVSLVLYKNPTNVQLRQERETGNQTNLLGFSMKAMIGAHEITI